MATKKECEKLMKTCLSKDEQIAYNSLIVLKKRANDRKSHVMLIQCRIVPVLFQLLEFVEVKNLTDRRRKTIDLLFSILGDLCNLQECREEVYKHLYGLEFLVLYFCECEHESIQNRSCRTVANLAKHPGLCESIHQTDFIETLVTRMETTENIHHQHTYCRAVRLLGKTPRQRDRILSHNAVYQVGKLIESEDASVRKEVYEVIEDYTVNRPTCEFAAQLVRSGAFKVIVDKLNPANIEEENSTFPLLCKLNQISKIRPEFGSTGGLQTFIEMFPQITDLSKQLTILNIVCLCCKESVNRVKVRNFGGLKILCETLKNEEYHKIHDRVISAVQCFVFDEAGLSMLLECDLVSILICHLQRVAEFESTSISVQSYLREEEGGDFVSTFSLGVFEKFYSHFVQKQEMDEHERDNGSNKNVFSIDSPTYEAKSDWNMEEYMSGAKCKETFEYIENPFSSSTSMSPLSTVSFYSPSMSPASDYSPPSSPGCSDSNAMNTDLNYSVICSMSYEANSSPGGYSPKKNEEDSSKLGSEVYSGSEDEDGTCSVKGNSEVQTPISKPTEDVQTSISKPMEDVQTPASKPMKDVQTPASKPMKDVQTPASKPMKDVQTPASKPMKDVQTPASKPMKDVQTPASKPMKDVQTPASKPMKDVQTPASKPMEGVQTPSSKPMKDVQTPASKPTEGVQTPLSKPNKGVKAPSINLFKNKREASDLSEGEEMEVTNKRRKTVAFEEAAMSTCVSARTEKKRRNGPCSTEEQILIILSRISQMFDPSKHLVTSETICCCLDYLALVSKPEKRMARTLSRILTNRLCLKSLLQIHMPFLIYYKLLRNTAVSYGEKILRSFLQSKHDCLKNKQWNKMRNRSDSEDSTSFQLSFLDIEDSWSSLTSPAGKIQESPGNQGREPQPTSTSENAASINQVSAKDEDHSFPFRAGLILLQDISTEMDGPYGRGEVAHWIHNVEDKDQAVFSLLFALWDTGMTKHYFIKQNFMETILKHVTSDITQHSKRAFIEALCFIGHIVLHTEPNKEADKLVLREIHVESSAMSPGSVCKYESIQGKDISFSVQNTILPGKKEVLTQSSDLFQAMLEGHYSEAKEEEILLPNTTPFAMRYILHYLHGCDLSCGLLGSVTTCDRADDTLCNILDIVVLGHQYMLNDLVDFLVKLLNSIVTPETACHVFHFALTYDFPKLITDCIKRVFSSPNVMERVKGFRNFLLGPDADHFIALLFDLLLDRKL